MNRPKIAATVAIMLAIGASAGAQAQPTSPGHPRTASQLLPEAQPPFDPKPDSTPAPANAAQGAGKSTAQPRSECDLNNLCASTYRSFRASDCTYQPYDGGPRRLCER
jgi:hypothetical protein